MVQLVSPRKLVSYLAYKLNVVKSFCVSLPLWLCHKIDGKKTLIWVVNEMYAKFWISSFNSQDTLGPSLLDTCLGVKSSFLSFPN
jgi:hypothetical protein